MASAGQEEHLHQGFADTADTVAAGLGGGCLDAVGAVTLAEEGLGGFVVSGEIDVEVGMQGELAVHDLEEEFIGTGVDGGLVVGASDVEADGVGGEGGGAIVDLLLNGGQRVEEQGNEAVIPRAEVAVGSHQRAALPEPGFEVETVALEVVDLRGEDDVAVAQALEEAGKPEVLQRGAGEEEALEASGVAKGKGSLSRPTPRPPCKGGSRMF